MDESDIFSANDDDIRDVYTHSMKMNQQRSVLVHQTYHSVSKHIYKELKNYIEDLNKQWIVHTNSAYSSPVVAVRRKK